LTTANNLKGTTFAKK